MSRERWLFDVPLDGDEEVYSIDQLLMMADDCFQKGEYAACHSFLERSSSGNRGRCKLAQFLMIPGTTNLPREKRLRQAESLLLEAVDEIPEAMPELSNLYLLLNRPLAALAWRLRYPQKLDEDECKMFKKKILQLEVSSFHSFPMDLYTLGMVLSDHKETYGQAKRLLRLACEYENDPCIKGVATLRVAEISDDPPNEQSQYFRLAKEWGNPELLRR